MPPTILAVDKIWDQAPHSAFTDLIRFQNHLWCTFREATDHGESLGTTRVICSQDGETWESTGELAEAGTDLRDPKLSITPAGRLMLVMGGSKYRGREYLTRSPRVAFSDDGHDWSPPVQVLAEDHWLWRVTWHEGIGYCVSKLGEGQDPRRGFLYSTTNGLDWEWITEFRLPDDEWTASETTLRIMPDGEMIALIRPHWIGTSRPPYVDWSFTRIDAALGGPNFIRWSSGSLWAASRGRLDQTHGTVLARMTRTSYEPVVLLPSGGDCSYPGMVEHDGRLWLSYYSTHEEKTSIYLAQIELPDD